MKSEKDEKDDCPPYEMISHEDFDVDFKKFEKIIITQLRLNQMLQNEDFMNTYSWNDIEVRIRKKPKKWNWLFSTF